MDPGDLGEQAYNLRPSGRFAVSLGQIAGRDILLYVTFVSGLALCAGRGSHCVACSKSGKVETGFSDETCD
jgi:hypothetical protein